MQKEFPRQVHGDSRIVKLQNFVAFGPFTYAEILSKCFAEKYTAPEFGKLWQDVTTKGAIPKESIMLLVILKKRSN